MKIMSNYLELYSASEETVEKISGVFHKSKTYNPPRNYIFRIEGRELLGARRSRKSNPGAIDFDIDGALNRRGTDEPITLFHKNLIKAYPPFEKRYPDVKGCIKEIYTKKIVQEPSQRYVTILKRSGVREQHMKDAADMTLKDIRFVPRTLDTFKELEENMLYCRGLGSGSWEYMVKNIGELLLHVRSEYCSGTQIPFYADGRIVGTIRPCISWNKAVRNQIFHRRVGCPNKFSIQFDNDPELEYPIALTQGLGLSIYVDFGPSSSLPEDVKKIIRNIGDERGLYKFPGTISIFLPEAREDMYKIIRPILIQEALMIVLSLYTKEGYRMLLNELDNYNEVYEICRKATGLEFEKSIGIFLKSSVDIIKISYPPFDIPKIKPHLDKVARRMLEEERREEMENIFNIVSANRPELGAIRENRQYMRDLSNELGLLTSFRR